MTDELDVNEHGKPRCPATTRAGSRCRATSGLQPDGFCFWHSPSTRERHHQASKRGGRQRKRRAFVSLNDSLPEPRTPDDVLRWSSWLARATATGVVDDRTSREVAGALRLVLKAFDDALLAAKVEELRHQVTRLKEERARG